MKAVRQCDGNKKGKLVVMDIEDYERKKAEKKLLMELQEAEKAVKDDIKLYKNENDVVAGSSSATSFLF